jgi:catalase
MHGFGSHTYSLINGAGERFWVKFHFKSLQGIANLTNAEGALMVGDDRESHQRDIFEAIKRNEYPRGGFACKSCRKGTPTESPLTRLISPRCGHIRTIL